ncbi:MAG: class I SAM-dependent DNA methyltransferase [Methylomonas sp.]|nr:class I SAM-dependent DNA methyltransferase [Methylomonas sp.]
MFGQNGQFLNLLINHSKVDGSDLHGVLSALFDTLNRPEDKRPKNLPEHLAAFPYINGALFQDGLAQCYFDEAARQTLIECARIDWSKISPAIFGSLFQAVMHFDDEAGKAKAKKRREFGAHYTSEANILKVIRPLFLDSLKAEFEKIRKDKKKLPAFQQKLAGLNFFDPACGCGNFLVIAYRELRLLEMEVIEAIWGKSLTGQLDVDTLIHCNVNQCHGIEIDPSAAQIATVALWLTDHQMNLRVQRFGNYYSRIPLVKKANIVWANALQIDWNEVLPAAQCSFVMGNPPFIGAKFLSDSQRIDSELVFKPLKNGGQLDYVAAWYVKASYYLEVNPVIPAAFVSTNSICQGEQVGVLWPWMLAKGIKIQFAHRTFRWSNEGKGIAAVHCIIIGFGFECAQNKHVIYDYGNDISGEPNAILANNINPYLVDAGNVIAIGQMKPLCKVPSIVNGSIPADGGNLILTAKEKDDLLNIEPLAKDWIRPYLGAEGFINNNLRYCLWLKDCSPSQLRKMPLVMERVKAVQKSREASPKAATREKAKTPTLFTENRQPEHGLYLAIPRTSSENRYYLPIGFLSAETIAANDLQFVPSALNLHFGVLSSAMHMAWMRITSGRLKSDIRYSVKFTYNTFPWPETATEKQRQIIETAALSVLDARKAHPTSTLADLYSPVTMPPNLSRAHAQLDKAVDAAYGYKGKKDDAERVAFLFGLYQQLVKH